MDISNYKFYKDILLNFKHFFECFNLTNNCILQGVCYQYDNKYIIDTNFKYLIDTEKFLLFNNLKNLKVLNFDTIFDEWNLIFFNQESFSNWFLIKWAYKRKCIVQGKILNRGQNGFSVGIFGFIGFLPKKHYLNSKNKLNSIFIIINIDYKKKFFLVSQKKSSKLVLKVLLKLKSKTELFILKKKKNKFFGEHILFG